MAREYRKDLMNRATNSLDVHGLECPRCGKRRLMYDDTWTADGMARWAVCENCGFRFAESLIESGWRKSFRFRKCKLLMEGQADG
jgi:DNA-directed RNA polymerase subunit RPC12/RpoP